MKLYYILFAILTLALSSPTFNEQDGVIILTKDNFEQAMKEYDYALIEFYAPWCHHCKKFAPEYAKAARKINEDHSDIKLFKVDITAERELANRFSITAVPTIRFFIKGKSSTDYVGGRMAEDVVNWLIDNHEHVDIADKDELPAERKDFESAHTIDPNHPEKPAEDLKNESEPRNADNRNPTANPNEVNTAENTPRYDRDREFRNDTQNDTYRNDTANNENLPRTEDIRNDAINNYNADSAAARDATRNYDQNGKRTDYIDGPRAEARNPNPNPETLDSQNRNDDNSKRDDWRGNNTWDGKTRPERPERTERTERTERNERPEGSERTKRPERTESRWRDNEAGKTETVEKMESEEINEIVEEGKDMRNTGNNNTMLLTIGTALIGIALLGYGVYRRRTKSVSSVPYRPVELV